VLFRPLPQGMQLLEAAVAAMDDPGIVPPPQDMASIGERMRRAYARSRARGYADLSKSEKRKLPFAYWVGSDPVLSQVEPDLVRQYWGKYLPEALRASPRSAKRWLAPLFFVYCERFSESDPFFKDFAAKLSALISLASGLYAQKLLDLNQSLGFFNPAEAPRRIANYIFINRSKGLDHLLLERQLWPAFLQTQMGVAIFKAALAIEISRFRDEQAAIFMMDWAKCGGTHIARSESRIQFANALLAPWAGHRPPDYVKNKLIDFFIQPGGYGDPRVDGHKHYQWDGVSQQARGVILHWLTGDTLRGFMRVLKITADEIWQHRQKFWMAYYEHGHIDEAWMALGVDAWRESASLRRETKGMGCGRLDGGAASDQSVLLLKIGDLVFTEWSHNGSLRAFKEGNPSAPRFYKDSYHGTDLRAATSLDFHDGLNQRPQLPHWHSDKGTWQRTARDFIRRKTGVHINDAEIL